MFLCRALEATCKGIGDIRVWGAASFQMDNLVKGQKVQMRPSEPLAELQALSRPTHPGSLSPTLGTLPVPYSPI